MGCWPTGRYGHLCEALGLQGPENTADDKAFTQQFFAKFKRAPSAKSWVGYVAIRTLLNAIEKAGSTNAEAIRVALEQVSHPYGDIKLGYRAFDHQMLMRVLVPEVKTQIKDAWNYFDVETRAPEKPGDLDIFYGTPEQIGCTIT